MEERTRLERTRIEQRRRMEEDGEDGGVRGWRGGGQGWVMEKEEYEVGEVGQDGVEDDNGGGGQGW